MKKAELEKQISDLNVVIAGLKTRLEIVETRPQFCLGHSCCCNHIHNMPNPTFPAQPFYTGPTWMGPTSTICCGTTSSGFPPGTIIN